MPFYEYRCSQCGAELTVRQPLHAPALTRCPQCGQEALKKKISLSGISIKGRRCEDLCGPTGSSSCCRHCPRKE